MKYLSPDLAVSPQLSADDVVELASRGFRAIVCNRPDGEGAGQPTFAEIAQAASAVGIAARYLPVAPGAATEADGAAFGAALRELPGPVLAYCRSGARAANLWSLSQALAAGP